MKRSEWQSLFANQPSGLSGSELARRIKQPPQLAIYWAKRLKYQLVDGRKHPKPEKFNSIRKVHIQDIDFSEPNNQILATKHGIRRQRVWQLRKKVEKV